MFSALEVFVHAGPVSLVAMSQLDWERDLLKGERRSSGPRRQLSIEVGPVRVYAYANSNRLEQSASKSCFAAGSPGRMQ